MSHTIALVDDDHNLLTSLSIALKDDGFLVQTYANGDAVLRSMTASPVDLAVLDIKMPRMDGVELLKRLRQTSSLPVIFLTSKDEEIDELLCLKMGADDYIRKPFSLRLLIERIHTVLRRTDLANSVEYADDEVEPKIVHGDLELDPARHECSWQGEGFTLTVTEFLILKCLSSRPGYVRSRNQLMDAAYDDNINVTDRNIDCHIKRIRKKIKAIDKNFTHIETLYGIGYRYNDQ